MHVCSLEVQFEDTTRTEESYRVQTAAQSIL